MRCTEYVDMHSLNPLSIVGCICWCHQPIWSWKNVHISVVVVRPAFSMHNHKQKYHWNQHYSYIQGSHKLNTSTRIRYFGHEDNQKLTSFLLYSIFFFRKFAHVNLLLLIITLTINSKNLMWGSWALLHVK